MSTGPATNHVLLEAKEISRRRADDHGWLLDHVSLAVPAGARLAVAGPSGAGKTLFLRAMAMLDPLDGGGVYWRGQTMHRDGIPRFRQAVSYLHQRPALLEGTVEAALRRPFALKIHSRQQFDRQRAIDLLAQLGRDGPFLDKSTADLSGGEMQITALVRALLLDPTVLLLDEPTAALDPQATTAVEELLDRWLSDRATERAMVWVSHDAEQARRVSQRTITMEAGKVSG
jgi:putative ABC transport system ATP-binding protein